MFLNVIFLFQLYEFEQPLDQCCGSSIFKIRELSAMALVSIIQKSLDAFVGLLSKMYNPHHNTNQRHGKLLQVWQYVMYYRDKHFSKHF